MGNTAATPSDHHRGQVELRLSRPNLPGSDLWRLHAEVLQPSSGNELGLWSSPSIPRRPRWEESFKMQVESDLEIRILQGDHLVAKAVLEVSRVQEAPPLAFRVISLPLTPGPGMLEVKLRQATEAVEKKFQFQMPMARRQVITLELQNAELVKLLRARQAVAVASASASARSPSASECSVPRGKRDFQEASQMRHQQLLEESYALNAQLLQQKQHLRRRLSALKMSSSELPKLRQNLAKALARQQQLQIEGEAKIAALQRQLQEAQEKALPESDVQAFVALALGRREELQRRCREATAQDNMSPELAGLQRRCMQQKQELEERREQMAQIQQSSHYQAWKRHEDAVAEVQHLFQSLEELSRSMQDDQVCHESEMLELRQERNALKDRLEDAISSLRQLSTRAELLQPGAAAGAEDLGSAAGAEPPEWQRRVGRAEGELQELKRMEALRLQQIKDLEMDQESLVEQTTLATALPGDTELKMANLEKNHARLQASVQSQQAKLHETRQMSQQVQAYIRRLQTQQLQLVSRADERVLRNPQPPSLPAARA